MRFNLETAVDRLISFVSHMGAEFMSVNAVYHLVSTLRTRLPQCWARMCLQVHTVHQARRMRLETPTSPFLAPWLRCSSLWNAVQRIVSPCQKAGKMHTRARPIVISRFKPLLQKGFTLIELLVAITILAIVAVLGWRGLDSIVRARTALNTEMTQTRGMQLAFAQIENDCAHVMDAALMPGQRVLLAAGNKLVLLRDVMEENQPVRYQVVIYSLLEGKLSRREMRASREIPELLHDWEKAMTDSDGATPIELQSNVANIAMRTWKQGETQWRVGGSDVQSQDANQNVGGVLIPNGPKTAKLSGLEVSLQLQGHNAPMRKVFLLGAA